MTQRIAAMTAVTCHMPTSDPTHPSHTQPLSYTLSSSADNPTSSPAPFSSPFPPSSSSSSSPSSTNPAMSVIAIDYERVCLYQQFDDTYPIVLHPHVSRSTYRSHIHRINAHWRRASLLYLLTLVAFLMFALGPILLGAAVNQHALTGVDEEVGVAMLLLGAVGLVLSVVLVRVCSRRMLLTAVAAENEKLKGSVPEMRFRVEHEVVTLPVKEKQATAGGAIVAGEQPVQQQQLESSEYRLLLEVELLPGSGVLDAAQLSAAVAEATLLSISSHFTLDPTAVLYHPNVCPHCLHDSPHSGLPLHSLYPLTPLYPLSATHPAVSPMLSAHFLSSLPPHTAHTQPLSALASAVDAVVVDIPRRPTDTTTADHRPAAAAALPATGTAQ